MPFKVNGAPTNGDVTNLNRRFGNIKVTDDDDGFRKVPEKKKNRMSMQRAPTTANTYGPQVSHQRNPGVFRPPTGSRGTPSAPNQSNAVPHNTNVWQNHRTKPPTQGSVVTKDFDVAIQEWGIKIAATAAGLTNASVAAWKPAFGEWCANRSHSVFSPGDIIWGLWVSPCLDKDAIKKDDPKSLASFAISQATGPISCKARPMIVSGVYKHHLLVYPSFSSGGYGLENKSDYQQSLCFPLLDSSHDVPAGTGMHYLRVNEDFESKQNSYVDMSKPYSLDLGTPIIAGCGKLTASSLARLHAYITPYLDMGRKKVVERGPFHHPQVASKFDGSSLRSPPPTKNTFRGS